MSSRAPPFDSTVEEQIISQSRIVLSVDSGVVVAVATRQSEYRSQNCHHRRYPGGVFAHVTISQVDAWHPWLDRSAMTQGTWCSGRHGCVYRVPATGRSVKVAGPDRKPANELIRIDLQFIKPFAGTSVAEFTFRPPAAPAPRHVGL